MHHCRQDASQPGSPSQSCGVHRFPPLILPQRQFEAPRVTAFKVNHRYQLVLYSLPCVLFSPPIHPFHAIGCGALLVTGMPELFQDSLSLVMLLLSDPHQFCYHQHYMANEPQSYFIYYPVTLLSTCLLQLQTIATSAWIHSKYPAPGPLGMPSIGSSRLI
jgi:hypothetical protein